ncbi:hypothetical protein GCM10009734_92770 [Nonomuraea bangladeshensis]
MLASSGCGGARGTRPLPLRTDRSFQIFQGCVPRPVCAPCGFGGGEGVTFGASAGKETASSGQRFCLRDRERVDLGKGRRSHMLMIDREH